ncbi:MAG: hypothetical protein V1874_12260 [Spirochaetota bacterium]
MSKKRIGFVIENQLPYYEATASTRLRCYDIIKFLNKHGYLAEIYTSSLKYDIVIFQKCFRKNHIDLAASLKESGVIVILDININIIELDGTVGIFNEIQEADRINQNDDIKKMIRIVDHILVSSPSLLNIYSKYHKSVFCIEENVTDDFFKFNKKHIADKHINILYQGYSIKAVEVLLIKEVLLELRNEYDIQLLFITDLDPKIEIIPYKFIKYNQKILPQLLLNADIKIAPRKLDNSYNLGHSFNKVAYPMSVGIPAVASPVPSYLNREVIICYNNEDWYKTLKSLIFDSKLRSYIGMISRNFVKTNFSSKKIGMEYITFIKFIME